MADCTRFRSFFQTTLAGLRLSGDNEAVCMGKDCVTDDGERGRLKSWILGFRRRFYLFF